MVTRFLQPGFSVCGDRCGGRGWDSSRDGLPSQLIIEPQQGFETEILARERDIAAVDAKAQQLIDSGHFAARTIQEHREGLLAAWDRFRSAAGLRAEVGGRVSPRVKLLVLLSWHPTYAEARRLCSAAHLPR